VIDSHAHLADPAFDADRTEVVARARGAGLEGIVCIGESDPAEARARALAAAPPEGALLVTGSHYALAPASARIRG